MVHDPPTAEMFTAAFWDERYGGTDRYWSGNPNTQLVAEVTGVTPGSALDVGCGEGADAIWLAERGWAVTAVDVSPVALARGAEHAAERGVGDSIEWQRVDAFEWGPPPGAYDLVSAQFMYLPSRRAVDDLYCRLAAGVRAGGHLLIVGHHPTDATTGLRSEHLGEMGFTGEEVAALLDPEDWRLVTVAAPTRQQRASDGTLVAVTDALLHAVRR